jgi:high frequency lysogenization protein
MKDRVIALAALMQALQQVQSMANNGHFETRPLQICIESLFRFDAETPQEIYGGPSNLTHGLKVLLHQLEGPQRDVAQTKMAMNVMQLERLFSRSNEVMLAVQHQLKHLAGMMQERGATDADVLNKCGEVYANHISPLGPKVIVQGSPSYLSQPTVVGEIRAALLSGVRAAVLWRQMGGSQWDFFLSRGKMAKITRELLAQNL